MRTTLPNILGPFALGIIFFYQANSYAQGTGATEPKIKFSYDAVGNRVKREFKEDPIHTQSRTVEDSLFNIKVAVVPNPAIAFTNVQLPEQDGVIVTDNTFEIRMYDLAGKQYGAWRQSSGVVEIPLINLPEQIYLVEVHNGTRKTIKRIHKKKF